MRRSGWRAFLLAACMGAGALAAAITARTPQPRPADAPAAVFSAARAMADDRVIAAAPHPEGSPAALVARNYIFSRMAALGPASPTGAGRGGGGV